MIGQKLAKLAAGKGPAMAKRGFFRARPQAVSVGHHHQQPSRAVENAPALVKQAAGTGVELERVDKKQPVKLHVLQRQRPAIHQR